jgi:hypothetical protein
MQRKRSYLILIVGVFAVYTLCALALNLFSWLVTARDGVFEADLRFQQQQAHERKSNADARRNAGFSIARERGRFGA